MNPWVHWLHPSGVYRAAALLPLVVPLACRAGPWGDIPPPSSVSTACRARRQCCCWREGRAQGWGARCRRDALMWACLRASLSSRCAAFIRGREGGWGMAVSELPRCDPGVDIHIGRQEGGWGGGHWYGLAPEGMCECVHTCMVPHKGGCAPDPSYSDGR